VKVAIFHDYFGVIGGGKPEAFEDFLNLLQFALPCGNGGKVEDFLNLLQFALPFWNGKHPQKRQ